MSILLNYEEIKSCAVYILHMYHNHQKHLVPVIQDFYLINKNQMIGK